MPALVPHDVGDAGHDGNHVSEKKVT